jgi:two-component system KDP operon response regulator KdpE
MTESGPRVVVVDDEPAIRRFLHTSLSGHGYQMFEAVNGQEALSAVMAHRPDLVVLDLGLPDMDGIEVTRRLREWTQVPIIIVTVQEQEAAKVAALDAGADDYVTKPFSMGELLARMRAALRRAAAPTGEPVFSTGELTVDLARRLVTVSGREVQLTPTEYDLLLLLAENTGTVLEHEVLLRGVWGQEYTKDNDYLKVYIWHLRRKIEIDPRDPKLLLTEWGVGYRLIP